MMKLKQCKGFEHSICNTCKRKNKFVKETIIESLFKKVNKESVMDDIYCPHYIHNKT